MNLGYNQKSRHMDCALLSIAIGVFSKPRLLTFRNRIAKTTVLPGGRMPNCKLSSSRSNCPRLPVNNYLGLVFLIICGCLINNPLTAKTLEKSVECLVCGGMHNSADHVLIYKGMEFPLCSDSCVAHFQEAEAKGELDGITGKIEPRSALFQEDSIPQRLTGKMTFWLGYFILLGLVCGGMSAYLAVQKGLSGFNYFLAGFLLNFIGILLVALKRGEVMRFHADGLVKIPVTHAEVVCPQCGHHLHPAAKPIIAARPRI
jgi:hypothetical protein